MFNFKIIYIIFGSVLIFFIGLLSYKNYLITELTEEITEIKVHYINKEAELSKCLNQLVLQNDQIAKLKVDYNKIERNLKVLKDKYTGIQVPKDVSLESKVKYYESLFESLSKH